jgi:aminopeptidase N
MLIDLFLGVALTSMQAAAAAPIGPGVSEALAEERRAAIQELRYDVNFRVPAERRDPVRGCVGPENIPFD